MESRLQSHYPPTHSWGIKNYIKLWNMAIAFLSRRRKSWLDCSQWFFARPANDGIMNVHRNTIMHSSCLVTTALFSSRHKSWCRWIPSHLRILSRPSPSLFFSSAKFLSNLIKAPHRGLIRFSSQMKVNSASEYIQIIMLTGRHALIYRFS
jgi:hypothetical protein